MKIIDKIRAIEAHNKYAADFYTYDGWCIDEIMDDIAYSKDKYVFNKTRKEIKRELGEILSYCALKELDKYGFTSLSDKYYAELQDTCDHFKDYRTLDELYEELEIEDPYEEKEPEDTYDKYEYIDIEEYKKEV